MTEALTLTLNGAAEELAAIADPGERYRATQQVLSFAIECAAEGLAALPEPIERYQNAKETRDLLMGGDSRIKLVQREVANDLKEGRTWAQVGALLEVSGSRAEALAKGR